MASQSVTRYPQLLAELSFAFGRVGLFTFGGGQAAIPFIRREAVVQRKWLTEEEFMDLYALASALPGPIGMNMAGYIGYRTAGWPAALVAVIAMSAPIAVAMIMLASFYTAYQDHHLVQGFLAGIRPAVVAMLIVVVLGFYPAAISRVRGQSRRRLLWTIAIASLILMIALNLHPALVILGAGTVGVLTRRSKEVL